MKIKTSAELAKLLLDGGFGEAKEFYDLDAELMEYDFAIVTKQHPELSEPQRRARAEYRQITSRVAPKRPVQWGKMAIIAWRIAILILLSAIAAHGQGQAVRPDCVVPFEFTAAGRSASFDNRTIGCTTWHLTYYSTSFSAVEIQFDYANDNSGVPGSWTLWPNLANGSTLPLSATTSGQSTGKLYHPWVSVVLNSKTGTGTVRGTLVGFRGNISSISTNTNGIIDIACISNCPADFIAGDTVPFHGVLTYTVPISAIVDDTSTVTVGENAVGIPRMTGNRVLMANLRGSTGATMDAATGAAPPANSVMHAGLGSGATGGLVLNITVCDSFANVDIVTATTTLIVTGASGRHVRICAFSLSTAGANNVALISGTGATCGTGTTGMTGGTTAATGYNLAANAIFTQGTGLGVINRTNATGDSVCIITSAGTQLSGRIAYAIY